MKMRCPRCSCQDNRVLDSRQNQNGTSIRRRRECVACNFRFTSHEEIDAITMKVIKNNGNAEDFDWAKVRAGLNRALGKRPISTETLDEFYTNMEAEFTEISYKQKEIRSEDIGELVLKRLSELDAIAYIRFASVYKNFDQLDEFLRVINELNPKS